MSEGQEFWSRHVDAWRTSGLSQKAYSERHGLAYGAMGYWVRKLRAPGGDRQDQGLVELKAAAIEASAGVNQRPAIELVVAGRYLLRLWPGDAVRASARGDRGPRRAVGDRARARRSADLRAPGSHRQRRILKALYWGRTGFCLWMKRLENHRFPWPRNATEARQQIDESQLRLLLSGVDFWGAHEEVFYSKVGGSHCHPSLACARHCRCRSTLPPSPPRTRGYAMSLPENARPTTSWATPLRSSPGWPSILAATTRKSMLWTFRSSDRSDPTRGQPSSRGTRFSTARSFGRTP